MSLKNKVEDLWSKQLVILTDSLTVLFELNMRSVVSGGLVPYRAMRALLAENFSSDNKKEIGLRNIFRHHVIDECIESLDFTAIIEEFDYYYKKFYDLNDVELKTTEDFLFLFIIKSRLCFYLLSIFELIANEAEHISDDALFVELCHDATDKVLSFNSGWTNMSDKEMVAYNEIIRIYQSSLFFKDAKMEELFESSADTLLDKTSKIIKHELRYLDDMLYKAKLHFHNKSEIDHFYSVIDRRKSDANYDFDTMEREFDEYFNIVINCCESSGKLARMVIGLKENLEILTNKELDDHNSIKDIWTCPFE